MPPFDEFEGTSQFDPALLREAQRVPVDEGHYLVMIAGVQLGLRVEVTACPVTIGRSHDQTLVFAGDSSLSRHHSQIALVNDTLVIEDLGSTNGTWVDGVRIDRARPLAEGAVVKVGEQIFKYERRSREDVRRSEELDRDLTRARGYVMALLPEPLTDDPVHTNWRFEPSAKLGGDAFGYLWLDDESFAFFLIDVSGHGVAAAMHSVTVLNVLRQRALAGVDWHNPGAVLATLNDRFQMESHGGMLVTAWYGVYDTTKRTLSFSAAGHHAAYLRVPGSAAAAPLGVKALMIGAVPGLSYPVQRTAIPAGSSVYVFSDGVFEVTTKDRRQWSLADFLPSLMAPPVAGVTESERLYRTIRDVAGPGLLEDDLSIVVATFT
ncbi:MAG TPA: SpoIIE family protein phosphatase [Vicinamibacterales bacterium]|nr:SpoIIE family protein phosphatase [Vicinamibacterales bacterium]